MKRETLLLASLVMNVFTICYAQSSTLRSPGTVVGIVDVVQCAGNAAVAISQTTPSSTVQIRGVVPSGKPGVVLQEVTGKTLKPLEGLTGFDDFKPAAGVCAGTQGKNNVYLLGTRMQETHKVVSLIKFDLGLRKPLWELTLVDTVLNASDTQPVDLAVDSADMVWVVSNVAGNIANLPGGNDSDLLLQHVSPEGKLLSSKRLVQPGDDVAQSLSLSTIKDNTQVLPTQWIVGSTTSAANLGIPSAAGSTDDNVLVVGLVNGNLQSRTVFGGPQNDMATGVVATDQGVYVSGWSYSALGSSNRSDKDSDAFIASLKLTPPATRCVSLTLMAKGGCSGPVPALTFVKPPQNYGTLRHDDAFRALIRLPDGDLLAAGDTDGVVGDQLSSGRKDLLLVRYSPSLTLKAERQLGTSGDDRISSLSLGEDGQLYLAGLTAPENDLPTAYLQVVDKAFYKLWAYIPIPMK